MHPATTPSPSLARRDWIAAATLSAIAFGVFAPSIFYGFVTFDDPYYVAQNPHVLSGLNGDSIAWAWTTFDQSNWHPLTWLSLEFDVTLAGQSPRVFHFTNVLLHSANAALVFLVLRSMTGAFWRSAIAALLFAVHPLRVESVAWITERKDVLSTFFGLLALWAWASYTAAPSVLRYLSVAVALTLSLLAKPMLVTMPFLLLILDWWPLRRVQTRPDRGWLVLEKLPLLLLVSVSAVLTYLAQAERGAVKDLTTIPVLMRVENAALSCVQYLFKTAWPFALGVYYPYPDSSLPVWKPVGASLLLALATAGAVTWRRRAPCLLAGWLWYLGTLVPVIGLVQVGHQAMADRYTYFPQIGVWLLLCWGVADLAAAYNREAVIAAAGLALAFAVALMMVTYEQLKIWQDSVLLWQHTIRVAGKSMTSVLSLGRALEDQARFEEAVRTYREALELDPNSAEALTYLGGLLSKLGRPDEAAPLLEQACSSIDQTALAHSYLGNVYIQQGKLADAVREEEKAIELDPELFAARASLGQAEQARGNLERATACYEEVVRLSPSLAEARYALGNLRLIQGDTENAVLHLGAAVKFRPDFAEAYLQLGKALEARGQIDRAEQCYSQAARLNPRSADALYHCGMVLVRHEHFDEAAKCVEMALELNPGSAPYKVLLAQILDALSTVQASAGNLAEATSTERRARDLAKATGERELLRLIEEQLKRFERDEISRPATTPATARH